MFNEHEIEYFLQEPKIQAHVAEIKKRFILREAEFLEIGDHDFLSLVMITPSIGIALANGNVSLFEELALNKIARRMSKGGHRFKKDPVAHAMRFFIKNYDHWEMPFLDIINRCLNYSLNGRELVKIPAEANFDDPVRNFIQYLMKAPYSLVKFLTLFLLRDEKNIIQQREVSKDEYEKILDLMKKAELYQYPMMQSFLSTLRVK